MSKVKAGAAVAKNVGKASKTSAPKVIHGAIMKTYVPAGLASAAPPLGTMLGQRGVNIANFVKDFNEQTKNIKDGIPLPIWLQVQADRSYILEILKPPVSFLIKQAAGITRASMEPGHKIAGVISIKHVYEIAKFKISDKNCAHLDLKQMCQRVINAANRSGIKVVKHELDETELGEFLTRRKELELAEKAELADKKAAKAMRASAAAASLAAEKSAASAAKK